MNHLRTIGNLLNRSPKINLQQSRGIRVEVRNGNLESALKFMERKMKWSGIERMIKKEQTNHIKNCEKKQLAIKRVLFRTRSEGIARIYQSILTKKVRGL